MRFLSDDRAVEKGDDKRTLEVIAAGLPRCATSSLQAALESEWLGYAPSLHMAHVFPWPEREQLVIDAMNEPDEIERKKILYKLIDGHAATCDFPGQAFTPELMDMYPNAKIILNQRSNGTVWVKSWNDAFWFYKTIWYRIIGFPFETDRKMWYMHQGLLGYIPAKVGTKVINTEETYELWFQYIRDEARKRGREVLEFKPEMGWQPLCEFLGKRTPPPEVPFPRTNDAKMMKNLRRYIIARGLFAWGLWIAGGVSSVMWLRFYAPRMIALTSNTVGRLR